MVTMKYLQAMLGLPFTHKIFILFGSFLYDQCVHPWLWQSMYVKTMYVNWLHIFMEDNVFLLDKFLDIDGSATLVLIW